jgi:signal transduction histidine kinase
MLGQVERLGRLVNQLLDLSKLESGVVPLQQRPFELRTLLEQAAHEARVNSEQIGAGAIRIEVELDPPNLRADGDPERLHQVLSNLLDNAVRHSPEGGRIQLSARAGRGRIELEVLDEGPGIAPGEEARVFERFYRSDAARSVSEGGTGLGLAIARWIVDLHGGEIRAERREPRGCRMIVELPAVAA